MYAWYRCRDPKTPDHYESLIHCGENHPGDSEIVAGRVKEDQATVVLYRPDFDLANVTAGAATAAEISG